MDTNKINSPFFTFEESGNYFVYDGGNGMLSKISKLYYDILNYMKLYNIYDAEDVETITSLLTTSYKKEEIGKVIEELKEYNKKGFLKDVEVIYKHYEEKYDRTSQGQVNNNLWINISHDCNLRCKYCFGNGGDYGKQRILMTKETAKKCIDYWYSQVDMSQSLLEVNFFGGEPLMNQNVLEYCVTYINELFKDKKPVIRYNITTNGTIANEKILTLLRENKFRVSVSIDGIQKLHDATRPYVSGRGSFNDIVKNISFIKQYIPKISAQITLTKDGIPFLSTAVQELWKLGINQVRSNLVFGEDEVYDYEAYAIYHSEIKKISKMTYDNLVKGEYYTFQNLVNGMSKFARKQASVNCFFWGGGALIFSPEGDLYKCYRLIGNDEYKITDINNIDELKQIKVNVKPRVKKCSQCWAQLQCGDGCVYENSVYSSDINEPAQEWCTKTKISLEESLRLYARLTVNHPEVIGKILNRRK